MRSARRIVYVGIAVVLLALIGVLPITSMPARGQQATAQPEVFVEAIGTANLRAGPGTNYEMIGSIQAGTQYRMIGRSSHYPWYLIVLSDSLAWVYKDLVKVYGDINTVPYNEQVITVFPNRTATPLPTATATEFTGAIPPTVALTETPTPPPAVTYMIITNTPTQAVATTTPTVGPPFVTLTLPPATGVSITPTGNVANVRFGPGEQFAVLGQIRRGDSYIVLRRHESLGWVEIAYPNVAWGRGWVSLTVVAVTGDLNALPAVTGVDAGYPTLTPSPNPITTSQPPWATPLADANFNQVLYDLTVAIDARLKAINFVPGGGDQGKQASVFIMNLSTGHVFNLNPDVAYTGASILKVPVLLALYNKLDAPPNRDLAYLIASMIVCSENTSSNTLLSFIGEGDVNRGAQIVTEAMKALGLTHTIMTEGFDIVNQNDVTITPFPSGFTPSILTGIDQISTQPDPEKQTTPEDMGYLMAGIYQCAVDGTGPLISTFGGKVTQDECRQMMYIMEQPAGKAMIPAGLPNDPAVIVAHKRGLVEEMNGDAAIVLTPGGDYVLVIMMRQPIYLSFNVSFPAMSEISRLTYNAFNPSRALAEADNQSIPACQLSNSMYDALQSSIGPAVR